MVTRMLGLDVGNSSSTPHSAVMINVFSRTACYSEKGELIIPVGQHLLWMQEVPGLVPNISSEKAIGYQNWERVSVFVVCLSICLFDQDFEESLSVRQWTSKPEVVVCLVCRSASYHQENVYDLVVCH